MNRRTLFAPALVVAVGLGAVIGSLAIAEAPKDSPKPAGSAEAKLPPGWTEADMQACMMAGTPGKMHEHLAKGVGEWHGKSTMWMAPGAEPGTSECKAAVRSIMDGRFTQVEHTGEVPGMGPYNGLGVNGFDNVSKKFVSTWIDNMGTGIMQGEGELSPDGKTITWKFTYNCPVTNKPAVMRQIEEITGPDTKTIEMFAAEPKSGEEYKMMTIELSKKS